MTDLNNLSIDNLITDNIDVWTSAIKKRNSQGRGSNSKIELTGVKKLRELILELAVSSKLVPQNPNDEPASELLVKIAEVKAQLIADKKIKKQKPLPPIEVENTLSLPIGWETVRFIDVLDFSGGGQPPKSFFSEEKLEGYVQLIQIRDLGPNPQPVYIPKDKASKFCTESDVMVGRYGASVGKVFWGKDGAYNVALIRIHNDFDSYFSGFIFLLLKSPLGQKLFTGISRSAQDGFNKDDIAPALLPLPPIAEQHRIVAKVDELMVLCDQLEQQTEQSLTAHQTLVEALLNTLTQSVNADDFQESWQRIADHFDVLFTTEASIDQLKQTILQLAVMGKLVPQNPSDEPASKLLEKIAEEKAQLIKDKKIKKQKPLPEITEQEKLFQLPSGWEYIRLDEVSLNSEAGWSPSCLPTARENGRWGVLKVSAVTWGKFNPEENKELPSELEPRVQYEVQSGDFLISRANTAELVARAVVVPRGAPKKLMMSDKIIRFVFSQLVDSQFISLVNSSSFAREYYASLAGGTSSSMKNVSREHIRSLVVALPPLGEQYSIIAKVDEFTTICEQLKARIRDAQNTKIKLADTIVNGVLI